MARFFPLAALSAIFTGCAASPLAHTPEELRRHVIVVDGKGRPHDPLSPHGPAYTIQQYRSSLAQIFAAMHDYHANHPGKKVLIFVHGGLNSPADSLACADQEMDHVMAAGYYPIYLDWNSDLFSTYGDHIATITQGQTDNTLVRALLSPAYILADIGRAAARMPIVWINQFAGDLAGAATDVAALPRARQIAAATQPAQDLQIQRWARSSHGRALVTAYLQLRAQQSDDAGQSQRRHLRIYIGPDLDVKPSHLAAQSAMYLLTFPVKLLSQPLIDWLGTPAWQVMSRRTLMAFDGDLGGNPGNPNLDPTLVGRREKRGSRAVDFSTTGAIEVFREQLQTIAGDYLPASNPSTDKPPSSASRPASDNAYHITLVGHSMGTMILNEWLRRDLLESRHQLYQNIVYMAAACSVRDFGRSVVPYLLDQPGAQFYNLMLHPLADYRERRRFYDLPPRGSLLVWLDNFLTEPQTPLDRTLGRWDNIINATEVIPEKICGQVTLKAFALAPYNNPTPPPGMPDFGPQEHGQFRGRPYWCPNFWTDQHPVIPDCCCNVPTTQSAA